MKFEIGRTYISPAGNKRQIVGITGSRVTYTLTYSGADSPHAKYTVSQRWFKEILEVD